MADYFEPGNFDWAPMDNRMLASAFRAVTLVDGWRYLQTVRFNLVDMTTNPPRMLKVITDKIFELYSGHSGASMVWTICELTKIATMGWKFYVQAYFDSDPTCSRLMTNSVSIKLIAGSGTGGSKYDPTKMGNPTKTYLDNIVTPNNSPVNDVSIVDSTIETQQDAFDILGVHLENTATSVDLPPETPTDYDTDESWCLDDQHGWDTTPRVENHDEKNNRANICNGSQWFDGYFGSFDGV